MKKLQITYIGTPDFSACFLEKILTDKSLPATVSTVITQPDKPAGRKQILTPTPVKEKAVLYKIKTTTQLSELTHCDLVVLFAYGERIPKKLLTVPQYGFWNIHPSLLPLYRGASPISFPLIFGDSQTGVTLMQMDEELDHGDIIAQEKIEIQPTDTRTSLENKLTDLGYELFKKSLFELVEKKKVTLTPQIHEDATYTKPLKKRDGYIPFLKLQKALHNELLTKIDFPAFDANRLSLFNLFRGLSPWPGIWTKISINGGEKRLKIIELDITQNKLIIKKVQLEGKKEVTFKQFQEAYGTW